MRYVTNPDAKVGSEIEKVNVLLSKITNYY